MKKYGVILIVLSILISLVCSMYPIHNDMSAFYILSFFVFIYGGCLVIYHHEATK